MAFDHDTAPKGASKAGAVKAAALNTAQADAMQAAQLAAPAARGGQAAVATKVVSAADGVVRLPAGAALDNVHAEGRDLVIQLPDGSQIVVTDGAVTVPQVMVGDVVVDAQNIIALLVGNEPQPAAGPPSSSGGNFAVALGDIGKGIAIGDLLPPTQLGFGQPDTREAFTLAIDEEPTVIIITPDNPVGAIAASQAVSEAGLPARGGESAGTGAGNGSNAVSGTISFTPGNEPSTLTIDGQAAVLGATIASAHGVLTITSVAPGLIGYTYTLTDNIVHPGAADVASETFAVVVTDNDGDTASAALTINVMDDAPIARADTDGVTEDGVAIANGNVMTGVFTGQNADANATDGVVDSQGADSAIVTGVAVGAVASASGNVGSMLFGSYGMLVLSANGNYVYTLNNNMPSVQHLKAGQTGVETFTYTVTDGDGDVATTTLTINVVGTNDAPLVGTVFTSVSEEGLANGLADTAGSPDTTNAAVVTGTLSVGDVDGDVLTATLQAPAAALTSGGVAVTWTGVGTGTLIGSAGGVEVVRVTITAGGAYTVTLSQPVDQAGAGEDAKSFTVPVSVSDGTVTSTGSLTIAVEDDSPIVTRAEVGLPTLTVDESNLSANATASFASVFTAAFGADGPAAAGATTYALGVGAGVTGLVDTTTGSAVVLTLEAGQVVGRAGAGGAIVFTVAVAADGSVSLDQQRAVLHADANNADDAKGLAAADLVTLTVTVTDKDGDHASAGANIGQAISFKDDGPAITAAAAELPTLTVDESNLAGNATANFAGAFTAAFGADGAAAANALTFALTVKSAGVASGLVDTATGQAVVLTLEAGQVVGRAGPAGPVVFIVQVDAAGAVTLDQQRAVVHADANNANDGKGLAAADLIALTATITDKDGDHASAGTNIGAQLSFLDDGPAITAGQEIPFLMVDESNLATNATVSFAGAFTAAFGADGPAAASAVTYALGVNAGASGLVDTASGQAVVLTLEAGQVVGRAGAAGPVVFIVTLAADGSVTLDQQRAVVHPDGSNANDSVTLAAANLITVTATATDKDGDHASASINIGQSLSFADDAPHAANDAAAIAEGDIAPVAGNVLSNDAAGADAQPHVIAVGGLAANVGASLTLAHGTLTLNADGSYSYALNNADPAVNGLTDGQTLTETVTYAMADADGDTSPATLTITINGVNDGPVIGNALATVSEEGLATGLPDGAGVSDTTDDAVFTGSIAVSDVDGPSMTVTLGAPGAVLTSGGVALDWTGMGSNTLVGSAGGNEVIRVVIDDAGHYTVSLSGPVDHPVNPTEDALSFVVPVIANDSIASASGQLTITIEDDRPELAPFDAAPILTVDETNLSANATASFANVFVPTFGADGAAVANAMTFFLDVKADGAASGLFDTATGQAIVLHLEGEQVVGRAGAGAGDPVAFIVSVNADGEVTLDQQRAVVHPTADPNEPVTLAATNLVNLLLVATDGDGDTAKVVVEIGKNLVFLDDGPAVTLTGAVPTITVDESNLALNAPGDFAAMFTAAFGADGPAAAGAMTYSLGVNAGASGLVDTVSGQAVVLTLEAGQVVGRAGPAGPVVFLISLDANGMAVLDQQRSVLHSDPNNANDTVGLAAANLVTVTATATDLDGDHAQVLANVGQSFRFQDDAPYVIRSLNPIPTLTVDESNLAADAQASFASVFVGPFGSDGPAAANALTYALGVTAGVSGLTDAATGQAVVLSMNAGVVQGRTAGSGELVFTLAVNASGVVTLDQVRAVVHPNSGDANEAVTLNSAGLVTLTATATDSEGDHASATAGIGQSISFRDDGPSISVSAAAPALTVDETSLATDASANFATAFTANLGADGAGQVAYALTVKAAGADSGLIDTATGQHVVLSLNAGVVEGHTAGSNALVFTVKVDSAGVVTLDQLRALDHPDTGNANDGVSLAAADLISLTATITDKDGDHSSASLDLGQSLIFQDDAASLGAFGDMTVVSGAGATANGSFAYTPGADGHAGFTVTGPAIAGITYATTTLADGVKLSGMADPDGAGGNAPVTVFTYTVHNDGTTQFQLVNPQVGSSNGVSLLSLSAGGPSSFVDTPNHRIEFTGSGSGINSSSQGFGVGNQFVGNGESFTIEFHSTGTAGNQAPNVDPELVSSVTLKNDNINGSLTVTWTAFNDTDGTSQTGTKTVSGSTTLIDPTIDFNRISIVGSGGSGQGVRFVALDYGKTVLPADIDLSFQVKAIDLDGDVTSTSTQVVHVNATPPIVLDLDGDGLEFQTTDAGVHYDYNGDGHASATAWVGSQDGLLAYDHDGNGLVTGGEINFAVDGSTDLEGLRLQFDSNADGKLTAADADFGKFGVWQDANANGVTDAGEFKSLAAMGIAAINLTSDGKSYVTGEGQVLVNGQASYTRADGSTGLVGDVSFATRESEKQTASTAAVANSLVAAAMIAGAAVAVVAVAEEPVHSSSPVSMVAVEEDTRLRALDEAHGQVQAQDGVLVRATIEADAGPISSASHAEASSAQAHAAEVAMSADTAPSALAQDSAPVQAGHALPMLVSAEAMPAIPAQLIAAAQAAQTAAHPGQAATLAEVLADALGGGAHNGSSIDTLLANLPSAQGATEAHLAIAQAPAQLVEMMHVQVAAPATAYEMATMSPDAVHPLTNG